MSHNFTADLTFSDDILGEDSVPIHAAIESYDGGPAPQNINESLQSNISQIIDASVFDQAFVEGEQNEHDNTLNEELPQSQNILEYSTDGQASSQVEIVLQNIDGVDIAHATVKEETSAGIVANSAASLMMMSDERSTASFKHLATANHVSFGVKLEKNLDEMQKSNLERLLKAKMKSDVWMREEVERSQAFLRLYRIRQGVENVELEPIQEAG